MLKFSALDGVKSYLTAITYLGLLLSKSLISTPGYDCTLLNTLSNKIKLTEKKNKLIWSSGLWVGWVHLHLIPFKIILYPNKWQVHGSEVSELWLRSGNVLYSVLYPNQTCDDISACAENADVSPWWLWNISIASDKALLFWCLFYMWIGLTAHKFEALLKVSLAIPYLRGGSLAKRVWLAYISFIILTFLSKGYIHFTTKALSQYAISQYYLASFLFD